MNKRIEDNYNSAKEFYNSIGIDVEEKLRRLKDFSICLKENGRCTVLLD